MLDVATGAGHAALALAPSVYECIGLDLTPEMVQAAEELAAERGVKNVYFLQGDVKELPFARATFDVVTCRYAAHHFANIEAAMKEISRVMKPGESSCSLTMSLRTIPSSMRSST